MGFINMQSAHVGLVIKLFTGSISMRYHVVFDAMFSTVVVSTALDIELWERLVL